MAEDLLTRPHFEYRKESSSAVYYVQSCFRRTFNTAVSPICILQEVEVKMHELNKNNVLFKMGEHEIQICRRDRKNAVRYANAAMLINDLDRLRDGLLIWVHTIVRAIGYKHFVKTHYPVIQEVVQQYLTPEEADLILPALQVDHTILSA